VGTQERPAPLHPLELVAAVGVDAEARAGRVAARARGIDVKAGLIPVVAPLPDVAGHVVQAEAVGRVGADRGGAGVAVVGGVAAGEGALEGVGHPLAAGSGLVAPVVGLAVEPAAGGVLPLRLGRQALAGPLGVG